MMAEKIRFTKKILPFLAVLIILIFILNIIYVNLILPEKTFYRKEVLYQNYISNLTEKKIDYVFFGDSHTFHSINPDYIPNSYNYGTGAENYIKTFYKLRKMIDKDKVKVNTIVLELDLHTFSTRLTDKTNLFSEIELYSQFVSLDEIQKVRTEDSKIGLWLESRVPFIGNGKEFGILIKKPEFNEIYQNGWLKNKGNFSLENKSEKAFANYKSLYFGQERISNISIEYFIKTLEFAEKNNITIIFIKYPHSKEYDDIITENNITKEDYYDYIFKKVNSTIRDYYVLDYYSLFPEKDYLFGDAEHVNYLGSKFLSKEIYKDLRHMIKIKVE